MNNDQIANLLFPEQTGKDTHIWGNVKSINDDGSYQVQLNGSSVTTRCAPGCTAYEGDRVLVCCMANGRCVAVCRLGGDGSVGKANYSVQKLNGRIVTIDSNPEASITITTSGNPVFIICSGDANREGDGSWFYAKLYRNGELIKYNEWQASSVAYNTGFTLSILDDVPAGTYTYKIALAATSGSTFDLVDDGTEKTQLPSLIAFELVNNSKTFKTNISTFQTGGNWVPGQITQYAGTTAPIGWLMCDGSEVSRTEFVELFREIGTTYGSGDGSTTFNVPDLRGRFTLGKSSAHNLGSNGGQEEHSHEYGLRYGEYYGSITPPGTKDYENDTWIDATRNGSRSVYHTSASSGSTDSIYNYESYGNVSSSNSLPPYITVNYIICYQGTAFQQVKRDDVGYLKELLGIESQEKNFWQNRLRSTGQISTTSSTNIMSTSYETKTGRFVIQASAPIAVTTQTGGITLSVDGAEVTRSITNETGDWYLAAPQFIYDGIPGTYKVDMDLVSQSSSATAKISDYSDCFMMIYDI